MQDILFAYVPASYSFTPPPLQLLRSRFGVAGFGDKVGDLLNEVFVNWLRSSFGGIGFINGFGGLGGPSRSAFRAQLNYRSLYDIDMASQEIAELNNASKDGSSCHPVFSTHRFSPADIHTV